MPGLEFHSLRLSKIVVRYTLIVQSVGQLAIDLFGFSGKKSEVARSATIQAVPTAAGHLGRRDSLAPAGLDALAAGLLPPACPHVGEPALLHRLGIDAKVLRHRRLNDGAGSHAGVLLEILAHRRHHRLREANRDAGGFIFTHAGSIIGYPTVGQAGGGRADNALRTTCETEMWNDALERVRERARDVIGRAIENSRRRPDGTHEVMVSLDDATPEPFRCELTGDTDAFAEGVEAANAALERFAAACRQARRADGELFLDGDGKPVDPSSVEPAPCPDCRGTGSYAGLATVETCRTCGGRGVARPS